METEETDVTEKDMKLKLRFVIGGTSLPDKEMVFWVGSFWEYLSWVKLQRIIVETIGKRVQELPEQGRIQVTVETFKYVSHGQWIPMLKKPKGFVGPKTSLLKYMQAINKNLGTNKIYDPVLAIVFRINTIVDESMEGI